jgi:integrase
LTHTLYSLRHSFATLSLAAGADAKHISAVLGHKSVAFTLDTYTHLVPSLRKDAAKKLEKLLFKKRIAG